MARDCAPCWIPSAQRPHLASWETEADHPADSMRFEDRSHACAQPSDIHSQQDNRACTHAEASTQQYDDFSCIRFQKPNASLRQLKDYLDELIEPGAGMALAFAFQQLRWARIAQAPHASQALGFPALEQPWLRWLLWRIWLFLMPVPVHQLCIITRGSPARQPLTDQVMMQAHTGPSRL